MHISHFTFHARALQSGDQLPLVDPSGVLAHRRFARLALYPDRVNSLGLDFSAETELVKLQAGLA